MEQTASLDRLRARILDWRRAGARIAFVPTMGNLHAGHLTLVREARRLAGGQTERPCGRVVTSVFVNPMQFGPSEDLDAYPRTLERDRRLLADEGCDLLFAPGVSVMYPRGETGHTRVEVPGLSDILCGASRPGHFVGVATVVCKLFNMVQPDLAVFGEKDFQQLMVIRRMVEDLAMPVEIVGMPTTREPDGLALSSRNGYLSADERSRAPALYRALRAAADGLSTGREPAAIEAKAVGDLSAAGLVPEYVSIRSASDLSPPAEADRDLVVLAAARLGTTRLIDNVRVTRPGA